jgi:chorismate dehydratase
MNLTIGFIPYLNMVPFHQGFGPQPIQDGEWTLQFRSLSPRALGIEAESGRVDAGALSLVDLFRLENDFEPLGDFGVGVKRAAGSVLLFSKLPMSQITGMVAVTDETSTSVRLLQVLLENLYLRDAVSYGRVASSVLYDGSAEALLLIGDEALRARKDGVRGLPVVTDLATEWHAWQGTPFVFARWAVRKSLPEQAKTLLHGYLRNSLEKAVLNRDELAAAEQKARWLSTQEIADYWDGFHHNLTPGHLRSLEIFRGMSSPPVAAGNGYDDN